MVMIISSAAASVHVFVTHMYVTASSHLECKQAWQGCFSARPVVSQGFGKACTNATGNRAAAAGNHEQQRAPIPYPSTTRCCGTRSSNQPYAQAHRHVYGCTGIDWHVAVAGVLLFKSGAGIGCAHVCSVYRAEPHLWCWYVGALW